jgi:uncharacterized protein (TIGR01777 family)
MHILITGGSGLIGRTLTKGLLQDGHEVTILTRDAGRAVVPQGTHVQQWDARTPAGWGQLVEAVDAIVNLAGENLAGAGLLPRRWTADHKRLIRDSRIQAGQAVAEAIRNVSKLPEVLIQASGIGYYGPHGSEFMTEFSPPGHDFLARLTVEWEATTAEVEQLGVRRAIIRTGVVLSAEGGALPRLTLPYRLFVGGPMGSGRQYISWIHIVDEIGAIRFLIENEQANGAFNLAAPNPLTNAEFGKIIGRVLTRPSLLPVPGFALRTLFGEASTLVLDGQRARPKRLLETGYTFRFPEAEQALRDLLNG